MLPPAARVRAPHADEPRRRGARRRSSRTHGEAHVILTKRPGDDAVAPGRDRVPGRQAGSRRPVARRRGAARGGGGDRAARPTTVEVVGELDSLSTVASQFTITPFVGLLAEPPVLRPDPREVAAAFAVPISELLDPEAYREEIWELWGAWRPMAFFELPGETVWGATARILTGLLRFLTAFRRGESREGLGLTASLHQLPACDN